MANCHFHFLLCTFAIHLTSHQSMYRFHESSILILFSKLVLIKRTNYCGDHQAVFSSNNAMDILFKVFFEYQSLITSWKGKSEEQLNKDWRSTAGALRGEQLLWEATVVLICVITIATTLHDPIDHKQQTWSYAAHRAEVRCASSVVLICHVCHFLVHLKKSWLLKRLRPGSSATWT